MNSSILDFVTVLLRRFMKRMVKEGNDILFPAEDELQVDIDSDEQYEIYQANFSILCRESRDVFQTRMVESKSGPGHKHITIKWRGHKFTAYERIAWQAALGSDPKRELLSALRCHAGDAHPTLFVEPRK